MRHLVAGRKFGRSSPHRRAMLRNLATNLFRYERIKTTNAKAKELRKIAEKLISCGKRGDLHSRRLTRTYIDDREILKKIFTELKERFLKRKGGYTRILKLSQRIGDGAHMALIELIPDLKAKPKKGEQTAKSKKKKVEEKEPKAVEAKKVKEADMQEDASKEKEEMKPKDEKKD